MARRKGSLIQQPWDLLNSSRKKNRKLARDNTTTIKSKYEVCIIQLDD